MAERAPVMPVHPTSTAMLGTVVNHVAGVAQRCQLVKRAVAQRGRSQRRNITHPQDFHRVASVIWKILFDPAILSATLSAHTIAGRRMYAKNLALYDFRCFGQAKLSLQYPGRRGAKTSEIKNVNLILGDNGGGKSSLLRAIAIAIMSPVLQESGFVAHRMVRRPDGVEAFISLEALLDFTDMEDPNGPRGKRHAIELQANFEARAKHSRDRLIPGPVPKTSVADKIYDDFSPAFFLVAYGATRRVETSDYSESSARRQRGVRYQRVASLFEDQIALRPIQTWLPRIHGARRDEAIGLLNTVLPARIKFDGRFDEVEQQYLFDFDGLSTPFTSLSDGYKSFIAMAGDLIGHIAEVCPSYLKIDQVSGVVLIDEIDLHLHPEWQRTILPSFSYAFPRLQFICTTHSPLVASTVKMENVFITTPSNGGYSEVRQIEERLFGRSAEQILLSSYFGLESTRAETFLSEADNLLEAAAEGDASAAVAFLNKLAEPTNSFSTHHETPSTKKAEGVAGTPRRKRSS